jgi:murein L,D-transpeptidase YcbB/YkuD
VLQSRRLRSRVLWFLLMSMTEVGWAAASTALAQAPAADALKQIIEEGNPAVYGTAIATEKGNVLFFDDIYRHDERLQKALEARRVRS